MIFYGTSNGLVVKFNSKKQLKEQKYGEPLYNNSIIDIFFKDSFEQSIGYLASNGIYTTSDINNIFNTESIDLGVKNIISFSIDNKLDNLYCINNKGLIYLYKITNDTLNAFTY